MATDTPDLGYALTLPPKEAIAYFEAKGYRLSWDWRDTWQEAHARAFTVAKVTSLDLLQDIRSAVETALKDGRTEAWFENQLTPVLQAKGWWGRQSVIGPDGRPQTVQLGSARRLKTIFRTNMQTAYQAGRYVQFTQNAQARPYFQYVAVMDARTRPSHAAMNGRVFPWDDPVWQTAWPPCAFNCRCRVRALKARDLKERGLTLESSEGRLFQTTVSAGTSTTTGEVIRAPVTALRIPPRPVRVATRDSAEGELPAVKRGQVLLWDPQDDPAWSAGEGSPWKIDRRGTVFKPDAGWNYNPARAAYMPDLDRYSSDVAKQFVEGVVTGPEFERWFNVWHQAVADETENQTNADARKKGKSLARNRPTARAALDAAGLSGHPLSSGMEYPVAVLTETDRSALGTRSQSVLMSTGTLVEHLAAHPDIGLTDYRKVQHLIDRGEVYMGDDDTRVILLADDDGQLYKSVLKVDQKRQKIYLQTLFRVSKADADRQVRNKLKQLR